MSNSRWKLLNFSVLDSDEVEEPVTNVPAITTRVDFGIVPTQLVDRKLSNTHLQQSRSAFLDQFSITSRLPSTPDFHSTELYLATRVTAAIGPPQRSGADARQQRTTMVNDGRFCAGFFRCGIVRQKSLPGW